MRLIDADALMNEICKVHDEEAFTEEFELWINDAPTIDPVVHGEWIRQVDENDWVEFVCSECEFTCLEGADYIFCPKCGAKMDLKGETE